MDLEYTIKSENGIHARPASCLARILQKHPDVIVNVLHSGREYEVKSMLSIMKLGLKQNDNVIFRLDGPNQTEENALKKQLDELLADS